MMKRINVLSILLLMVMSYTTQLKAQSIKELQKEIDQQVWKPFKSAYERMDAEQLNQLYAEEVLRVTPAGIDTEGVFKQENLKRFKQREKEGTVISLDFWFDSRKTNQSTSYEVGVFRITSVTEGQKNVIYGQFHIVLKKLTGEWKITQDWDSISINGKKLDEKDFSYKNPAEF